MDGIRADTSMMHELERRDACLTRMKQYLAGHPEALPARGGEIMLSERLVDRGASLRIKLICYGSDNAALAVTHDCFSQDSDPEQIPLHFEKRGDDYYAEIDLAFDIPGNTRIEYWANREKLIRQVAVLDTGYMAVIPWVGANKPYLGEEIHRFDIPGDYWATPAFLDDPAETIRGFGDYLYGNRRYGDRLVSFANGKTFVPNAATDCLFDLPRDVQKKGFQQLREMMELLGCSPMELVASYTPGHDTLEILEELGVKGLTSLCAWQNWMDGGWKINHCGVANQPYYPASDDFRRAGELRDILCFTMGNATCNRNYSIMALDGCPTNVVPGERYLDHRVVNQQVQRFYDVFDGYIADAKNNSELLTITVALEAFRGFMDWTATNEAAVRYMVKRAAQEKIVFTSAADVADYHKKRKKPMQKGYFFQPDFYYGYHNGTLPGRVDDRIEADTPQYLAVVRRDSALPMYFYDYTKPWENDLFEDTERNVFGLVNPDEHKPSECCPKQVFTEDMQIETSWNGGHLQIQIRSENQKERMIIGVFDVPYAQDAEITFDKADLTFQKIRDPFTGNLHLFIDLGSLEAGETLINGYVAGAKREPVQAEILKDGFGAMYFGDHAYLRSVDRDAAISVDICAPDGAFLRLVSGDKIFAKDGALHFSVNTHWADEAPILYGYPKDLLEKNIPNAKICVTGETTCSRWSWLN